MKKNTLSGADLMVRAAHDEGVRLCLVQPGAGALPLARSLAREPGVRPVLALCEGVAAGIADGYARLARRPAMVLIQGLGLAHAAPHLRHARRARSSVLTVVAHELARVDGEPAAAETLEAIAATASGWHATTQHVADVGWDLIDAVGTCRVDRLPATLLVPLEVQGADAEELPVVPAERVRRAQVGEDRVVDCARRVFTAEVVVVLAGGDALRSEALPHLAALARCPGVRCFAESAPAVAERGAGRPGLPLLPACPEQVNRLLCGADLVLLVGAVLSSEVCGGLDAHADPPGRERLVTLCGPVDACADALGRLVESLPPSRRHPAPLQLRSTTPSAASPGDARGAAAAAQILAARLPQHAVLSVEDDGWSGTVASAASEAAPHTLLSTPGGSFGQALPVAVGAALAAPHRPVLAVQSPGGAHYTAQALWTMAREQLDVTVLIPSPRPARASRPRGRAGDRARPQGAIRLASPAHPAVGWAEIARGYGVPAHDAGSDDELDRVLATVLREKGPHVVLLDA